MKLPSLLLPIVLLAACQSSTPAMSAAKSSLQPPQSAAPQYTERTLIVFYDPETGSGPLLQAVKDYGAQIGYQYKNLNGISILLAQEQDIEAAQQHFRNVRGVLSVSRDRIMHLH
ncbi:hypothetical protein [Kingella denitrificans]